MKMNELRPSMPNYKLKDPNKSNVKRYELALLRSGYFFYFGRLNYYIGIIQLYFRKEKQNADSSFRKRHFVDEKPNDSSKRRRTDLMQLIAENLEERVGINWQNFLPIEVYF